MITYISQCWLEDDPHLTYLLFIALIDSDSLFKVHNLEIILIRLLFKPSTLATPTHTWSL